MYGQSLRAVINCCAIIIVRSSDMCKKANKNTIVSYDFSTLYTTSPQTFVAENPPISLNGLSNGNNRFILLVTKDKLS